MKSVVVTWSHIHKKTSWVSYCTFVKKIMRTWPSVPTPDKECWHLHSVSLQGETGPPGPPGPAVSTEAFVRMYITRTSMLDLSRFCFLGTKGRARRVRSWWSARREWHWCKCTFVTPLKVLLMCWQKLPPKRSVPRGFTTTRPDEENKIELSWGSKCENQNPTGWNFTTIKRNLIQLSIFLTGKTNKSKKLTFGARSSELFWICKYWIKPNKQTNKGSVQVTSHLVLHKTEEKFFSKDFYPGHGLDGKCFKMLAP